MAARLPAGEPSPELQAWLQPISCARLLAPDGVLSTHYCGVRTPRDLLLLTPTAIAHISSTLKKVPAKKFANALQSLRAEPAGSSPPRVPAQQQPPESSERPDISPELMATAAALGPIARLATAGGRVGTPGLDQLGLQRFRLGAPSDQYWDLWYQPDCSTEALFAAEKEMEGSPAPSWADPPDWWLKKMTGGGFPLSLAKSMHKELAELGCSVPTEAESKAAGFEPSLEKCTEQLHQILDMSAKLDEVKQLGSSLLKICGGEDGNLLLLEQHPDKCERFDLLYRELEAAGW